MGLFSEASSETIEGKHALSAARAIVLEIAQLKAAVAPVQQFMGTVPAFFFGLGDSPKRNIGLRQRVGRPGSPFGGLGFFDPQANVEHASSDELPPAFVTAEFLRSAKLREFEQCAQGSPSMYYWALQPIFDVRDHAVKMEILIRARNGTDSAPYEDVKALTDLAAADEVQSVYAMWKATELVDWSLKVLKDYPVFQSLMGISSNLRPFDLKPTSRLFKEFSQRFQRLSTADQDLLRQKLVIEVTEDQVMPSDVEYELQVWEDFGLCLSCDDVIGDLACQALGIGGQNFHTTSAIEPVLDHFRIVKVDIEWAGFALFLSHPAYHRWPDLKAQVLVHAQSKDRLHVLKGAQLRDSGMAHSALLAEFAAWALRMIGDGRLICVELTVSRGDKSTSYALRKLKELGLDIFGTHSASFCFQGGPTGPRAFEPSVLASAVVAPVPAA